jgi:glycosyltransferase involved in cell wall biosynthesis
MDNPVSLSAIMPQLVRGKLAEKSTLDRSSLEVLWGLDATRGGITASVPAFSAAISNNGRVKAQVVAFVPGSRSGKLEDTDRSIVTFPAGRVRWLRDSKLRAELEAIAANASIVHIHGLWQEHGLAAAAVARKLNVPYIVSAHGMLNVWALRAKRWKKEIYAALLERPYLTRACALRALTCPEVSDYRRFGLKAPVVVVPNGIALPEHADPLQFLIRFPALANRQLILYLGRLHPQKGPDLLIRAWSRIAKRFPDAHLVLAGPDEANTQAALVQLAEHLGNADRITFAGMLQGGVKWGAFAAAEVFVLPSHFEGFSVATLEAMACSRPVILTRQCNFPEVAQHQAGLVIEPDERQLERSLIDMLTLTARDRAAMGARGRELVRSQYSLTSVASSMAETYEWLLGGSLPQSVEIHYA